MARVIVVGDGPGGLSAALFLAKAGHQVTVFGADRTPLHTARLYNYLGISDILGSEFQRLGREQVMRFGGLLSNEQVTAVTSVDGGFRLETEAGESATADYLILGEGRHAPLADSLGLERTGVGIVVDREFRSSIERLYVVGRSARMKRSQAIISAGAGATAALDILSVEAGRDVQDWDRA